VVDTLYQPVGGIITLGGAGLDRSERCAAGRLGHRVCSRRGLGALMPSRRSVNTHGKIVVGFARFEFPRIIVSRHVPFAAHLVVDVLAELPRTGTGASAHAELVCADEAGPFCVLVVGSEGVAEDESTYGVSVAVGAVRIKFATLVTLLNIDLGQVTNTSDLNVVLCTNKVDALESAIRDETCASAALGAPSDFFPLGIANIAYRRRRPQAEIIGVVHPNGLAHRGLRRLGTAIVGAGLTALRFRGQLVVHVTGVPNLVIVVLVAVAGPDLHLVSVRHGAIGEVHAFALCPFDMVIAIFCVVKFLIGALGRTIPNLEFGSISILPVGDVNALGAVVN